MPRLRLTATHIKEWFQYQCQRKLVFSAIRSEAEGDAASAVPTLRTDRQPGAWTTFGSEFETRVLEQLDRDEATRVERVLRDDEPLAIAHREVREARRKKRELSER